jgi:DNA modification methylase
MPSRTAHTRGAIVLDCLLGSGTTLLAAEQTGRRGYGIELDPRYVDLALQRLAGVPVSSRFTPRRA